MFKNKIQPKVHSQMHSYAQKYCQIDIKTESMKMQFTFEYYENVSKQEASAIQRIMKLQIMNYV